MKETTFNHFRDIIYDQCGISLRQDKIALVSARVGKRMRKLQLTSHEHYLRCLLEDSSGAELSLFIDAISTNVTSFFRERDHFDFLKEDFSNRLAQGQSKFRFWSAASSTGEEAYSLMMELLSFQQAARLDLKILATDISNRVLDTAKRGEYEDSKLEDVSLAYRKRYFDAGVTDTGDGFVVKESVRRYVAFKRLNLTNTPFPMSGPFDAILCRNVMIYFDPETRKRLVDECYRLLKPGGHLLVGHSESLTGVDSGFTTVGPSVYVK